MDPSLAPSWQIYLMFTVNLIVIVTFIGKGLSVLLDVRDDIRTLKNHVGQKFPPMGILGDIHTLQKEHRHLRDNMIEISSELGLKRPNRS
jgi:hypothetical protein